MLLVLSSSGEVDVCRACDVLAKQLTLSILQPDGAAQGRKTNL